MLQLLDQLIKAGSMTSFASRQLPRRTEPLGTCFSFGCLWRVSALISKPQPTNGFFDDFADSATAIGALSANG